MTDKLLPCPFCGGEAIVVKTESCGRYIGCWDCGGRTEKFETDYAGSARDKSIAAWNRRVDARQLALKTRVCPMCEDCPDGCPVETPKDSRNIITNADRIRNMSDKELAVWLVGATACEFVCHDEEYCHGSECIERVASWLQQPVKEEV